MEAKITNTIMRNVLLMFTLHKINLLTAIVVFVLSVLAVLVVVADPSLRNTLS